MGRYKTPLFSYPKQYLNCGLLPIIDCYHPQLTSELFILQLVYQTPDKIVFNPLNYCDFLKMRTKQEHYTTYNCVCAINCA
jgi:hypothetical protein